MKEYSNVLLIITINLVASVIHRNKKVIHYIRRKTWKKLTVELTLSTLSVWAANNFAFANIHFYAMPCDIISLRPKNYTNIP